MSNEVFNTTTFTIASGTLTPRIDIWNNNLTENDLKAVIVLANFSTGTQTVNTSFSIAGDWYNLMDGTTIASTVSTVTLQPGEFRIYGNKPGSLGTQTPQQLTASVLYPNPATNLFYVSTPVNKAEVYALTGQLVKTFGSNANGNSFDVSGLSKGIYLVKITDTTNRVSTVKLVKE